MCAFKQSHDVNIYGSIFSLFFLIQRSMSVAQIRASMANVQTLGTVSFAHALKDTQTWIARRKSTNVALIRV